MGVGIAAAYVIIAPEVSGQTSCLCTPAPGDLFREDIRPYRCLAVPFESSVAAGWCTAEQLARARGEMTKRIRSVKGTRDILPPDSAVWTAVEVAARRVFASYGYREIRTPILESTELFVRGVGEASDIVGKEMYSFEDRKGRKLTLRPEGTAAVVRAFLEAGLQDGPLPERLYYIGPQFRYERPQKGRYRQFYQIGAEVLGDPGPVVDAELILMLLRFLGVLGFEDLVLRLNTVGDVASRDAYRQALRDYFEPVREQLGSDSQRRLDSNPLRILDSKDPQDQEFVAGAPNLGDHLSAESQALFKGVCEILDAFSVPYRVDPRLVRGLDYYAHTVFEIASEGLGAQDAIVGGGRYDGLVSSLGGPDLPAIGFAIGQDRLVSALSEDFVSEANAVAPVFVVPIGHEAVLPALRVAEELRSAGVEAATEVRPRSLRAALKRADRSGLRYVVLLGEDEVASGQLTLKDLESGEQHSLSLEELVEMVGETS